MSQIEVEQLRKYYAESDGGIGSLFGSSGGEIKAVDGISFTIEAGETVGLVGESGCGKSTVARTLVGLEEATGGSIRFDGAEMTELSRSELTDLRTNLQMVFQHPRASLNPRKTIREIVGEPFIVHEGLGGRELSREVTALLHEVDLKREHLYRFPMELSGGQCQRVAIARALALEPDIIVFDEPTSALDVSVQAEILNLLEELKTEYGFASLFISHDLSVIKHVCDRVLVMYLGKLVEEGPADRVLSDPQHPYTQALHSAIPSPDPTNEFEPIELEGDLPDPKNPPKGCRFHTRCPKVLPPEEREIDQQVWYEIHGFKQLVRNREIAVDDRDADDIRADLFTEEVSDRLPSAVAQALENVATEQWAAADASLNDLNSPCETITPETHEHVSDSSHVSRCHLHE